MSNFEQSLSGFIALSDAIFYYKATRPSGNIPACSNLAILCTWYGAAPKHIAKYVANYQRRYPSTSLLILTSSLPDMAWRSNAAQRKRLSPAMSVIAQHSGSGSEAGILLHIFSNAGAQTASQLANAWKEEFFEVDGRVVQLPIRAMVFDSSPGRLAGLHDSATAMTVHLSRHPITQFLALTMIYPFILLIWLVTKACRVENTVVKIRRELNDAALFGGDRGVARAYLYSKADEIVVWKDIISHAEDATQVSLVVDIVEFVGSGHVAHVLSDEKRYWEAIEKVLAVGDTYKSGLPVE